MRQGIDDRDAGADVEERLIRVLEERGEADGFNVCESVQISFGHRVTPWFEAPRLSLPHEREATVRRVVNREPRKPARSKASHAQPPLLDERALALGSPGYHTRSLNGSATSGEYLVKKQRNRAAKRPNTSFGVCLQGLWASSDIEKLEVNDTKRLTRTGVCK